MRLRHVVVPAIATTLALAGCSGGSESADSSGSDAAAPSSADAGSEAPESKAPESASESTAAPKESEAGSTTSTDAESGSEHSHPAGTDTKAEKAPNGPASETQLVGMAKTLGCHAPAFQKSGGDSAAGKAGAIGGVTCQAGKEAGYILALLKEGQTPDALAKSLGSMAKQSKPLPSLHSDNWVLFAPKGLTTTKPTFDKADLEVAKKKLGKGTISGA